MTVLKILEWPDKILDTKSPDVVDFDDKLKQTCQDMHETMNSANGIGLAANQVGILQRIITINIPFEEDPKNPEASIKYPWHNKAYTFINPVIVARSNKKTKYLEGCLSFPDVYDYVDRSETITVKAFDENGKEFTLEAQELMAICLQHEIDHIDGVVFLRE